MRMEMTADICIFVDKVWILCEVQFVYNDLDLDIRSPVIKMGFFDEEVTVSYKYEQMNGFSANSDLLKAVCLMNEWKD